MIVCASEKSCAIVDLERDGIVPGSIRLQVKYGRLNHNTSGDTPKFQMSSQVRVYSR